MCYGCHDLAMLCFDNNNITIITPFKILIVVALFMTLAIYVYVGMYKMNFKEINSRNRVHNYCFDYLMNSQSNPIFINRKNYQDLAISFTRDDP